MVVVKSDAVAGLYDFDFVEFQLFKLPIFEKISNFLLSRRIILNGVDLPQILEKLPFFFAIVEVDDLSF